VIETEIAGVYVDAGMNMMLQSGDCQGFYVLAENLCEEFVVQVGRSIVYPFIPGDLSDYDLETGIRLSTGLSVRKIAQGGSNVPFTSTSGISSAEESFIPFHGKPNGAATFPLADGGWVYVTDSEHANGKGGSYAVVFDTNGEVRDYQPLLQGTSRNNNGGASPFESWISCEAKEGGQCWQVDPTGEREPEVTILGGPDGGVLESFVRMMVLSVGRCGDRYKLFLFLPRLVICFDVL
jgi:hypothetical protein